MMSLEPGTKLGPYEILTPLGAGGMGEVYRARDTRLQRDVAIKSLPEAFEGDAERLARFEREARILASLNHPNIAGIYGLEEVEGRRYLALELVEGETLRQRLDRGALPLAEAVEVCRQVAAALEVAHESGIIHRDLKPGNVMSTLGGDVKVLDFGLAKGTTADSDLDLTRSPTMTHAATGAGVILGTAAYMSPEQARGKAVDRRTDIWSLGCLLYECLTGRQAFAGETLSDVIARILQGQPEWDALPANTPSNLRRLLERALDKDPRRRLRDAGDARLELEEAHAAQLSTSGIRAAPMAPGTSRVSWGRGLGLGVLLGVVLATAAMALVKSLSSGDEGTPARFSIHVPAELHVWTSGLASSANFDVAPDGSAVVVNASPDEGRSRLYVRHLRNETFRELQGTEGAIGSPDISPDGRTTLFRFNVGESGQRRLARVPLDGSAPPTTVCDLNETLGEFVPLPNGDFLFSRNDDKSFQRLSSTGQPRGEPIVVDAGDFSGDYDLDHCSASSVLDEEHVLVGTTYFTSGGWYKGVAVLDLETGKATPILEDAGHAVCIEPGTMVFSRGENLLAVPFDRKRRQTHGEPQTVFQGIRTAGMFIPGNFKVSRNGTLFYAPGGVVQAERTLALMDREGNIAPWSDEKRTFNDAWGIAISGDGKKMAVVVTNARGVDEIWGSDVEAPFLRRLVAVPQADVGAPVLSADGSWIAFRRSGRGEDDGIYVRAVDAMGDGIRVYTPPKPGGRWFPRSWAPDRSALLFDVWSFGSGDIGVVRLSKDGEPQSESSLLIAGDSNDWGAQFSPDGRWIAFQSNRFGSAQILACAYHRDGTISDIVSLTRTGSAVRWSGDGKKIYFFDTSGLQSADISVGDRIRAGPPIHVRDPVESIAAAGLLPDGRDLVLLQSEEEKRISRFDLVQHWAREVAKLSSGNKF